MQFLNQMIYRQAITDPNFVNHWYNLVDQYVNYFIKQSFHRNIIDIQKINLHKGVIQKIEVDGDFTSILVKCENNNIVSLCYNDVMYSGIDYYNKQDYSGQVILFDEWSTSNNGFVHEMACERKHIRIQAFGFTFASTR